MSFIKLDRNLLKSYCFANPDHLKVWIWLLIKANFQDNNILLQIGKGKITIPIKRGQLIFGRFVAENELNMNGSMIYRILKKFQKLNQIKIEPNNQYSIITICKYDSYQSNNSESEQQINSSCISDEQQVNILKEGLEGKESKEESTLPEKNISDNNLINSNLYRQPNIPTFDEVNMAFVQAGGTAEIAKLFYSRHSSTGWFLNNSPIINYKSLIPKFIENFNQYEYRKKSDDTKSGSKAGKKLTSDERFEFYTNYASQFSDGSDEKQTD